MYALHFTDRMIESLRLVMSSVVAQVKQHSWSWLKELSLYYHQRESRVACREDVHFGRRDWLVETSVRHGSYGHI